ncbi:unnamed protein product [Dicrocoelium dendriticum]|nr:unnamed protein product [Dicrocoelium dendriticum]
MLETLLQLTTLLESKAKVFSQLRNCQLVELFGHPTRGYVIITFGISKEQDRSIHTEEVIENLYHYFNKQTMGNANLPGPVVGKVRQHVISVDELGNTIIRFGMEIYENGQFHEWCMAYNTVTELKKIEESICPRVRSP